MRLLGISASRRFALPAVLLAPWLVVPAALSAQEAGPSTAPAAPAPHDAPAAKPAIGEGNVRVREILHALSRLTGANIVVPPKLAREVDRPIPIVRAIPDPDEAILRGLLALQDLRLVPTELEGGTRVLELRSGGSAEKAAEDGPGAAGRADGVFRMGPDGLEPVSPPDAPPPSATPGLGPDEVITVIFRLAHLDPSSAINVLAGIASPEASETLRMVEVPGSSRLVVTAPARTIDRLARVLCGVDVASEEPLPAAVALEVVELRHAEPDQVASFIQAILGTGASGGPRPPGRPSPPQAARLAADTTILPDARTGKLIVRTSSPEALAAVRRIVEALDVPVKAPVLETRVVQLRDAHAGELAETLEQAFGSTSMPMPGGLLRAGRAAPVFVPHGPTNSLVIQATPEAHEAILELIRKLDVRPADAGTPPDAPAAPAAAGPRPTALRGRPLPARPVPVRAIRPDPVQPPAPEPVPVPPGVQEPAPVPSPPQQPERP